MSEKIKLNLLKILNKKLAVKPLKLRSEFEIRCFTLKGIESIKESMLQTINLSTNEFAFRVNDN